MWCDRSRLLCLSECNNVVHRNGVYGLILGENNRFLNVTRCIKGDMFLWKPCGCLSENPFPSWLTWLVKLRLSRKIWLTCSGSVNQAHVRCQTGISKHKITRRPVSYGNRCHEYLIISVLLAAAVHISVFFIPGLQLRRIQTIQRELRGLGPHLRSIKTTQTNTHYIKRMWN